MLRMYEPMKMTERCDDRILRFPRARSKRRFAERYPENG
jgi:hypothetical protein